MANDDEPSRDHENPDPHELNRPVPWLIITFVVVLLVWAVAYILMQSPGAGEASLPR